MEKRGVLTRFPMFSEITKNGVKWEDGREIYADVILWNTGFRWPLSHLDSVLPREESDGIKMSGRLATEVAKDLLIPIYTQVSCTVRYSLLFA